MKSTGIILCLCSDRNIVDQKEILDIQKKLAGYDVKFSIIHPGLCSKDAGLPVLAGLAKSVDRLIVVGCHKRAQRWLFDGVLDKNKLVAVNIRDSSAEKVMKEIGKLLPLKGVAKSEWFPVIDRDLCIACGQCVDFCLFGVYAKNKGKVEVKNPYNCKDNCPACARVCPKGAIVFPKCPEDWVAGANVPRPKYKKMSREDIIKELKKKRSVYH